MRTSLYAKTRSKKQQEAVVLEKETSFLSISRRQRKKHSAEWEIQIMETSPITKQENEIIERAQQ